MLLGLFWDDLIEEFELNGVLSTLHSGSSEVELGWLDVELDGLWLELGDIDSEEYDVLLILVFVGALSPRNCSLSC